LPKIQKLSIELRLNTKVRKQHYKLYVFYFWVG
jgi:hypothetical protein